MKRAPTSKRIASETHLKLVNAILPRCSAEQAYFVGMASAAAIQKRIEPNEGLFVGARTSPSFVECHEWIREWIRERRQFLAEQNRRSSS